ncbi:MAG: hypothetical protein RBS39_11730 [Phycisphaerales bacterium]|jgi:hypothetical protein|nr:hypothetical protein [Phycisphaerales bacterium]
MNLGQFFEHWAIVENPFRGEEARHDAVFARMTDLAGEVRRRADAGIATHSDFEKILGDLARPATSIVFGEKGSGKTAIRMQIADRVARHNLARPDERVLLIPYDDLNSFLDRLHARSGGKDPLESFRSVRAADHLDAILAIAATRFTDSALGGSHDPGVTQITGGRTLRRLDKRVRRDMLLLQAFYDTGDGAHDRTLALRRRLSLPAPTSRRLWGALCVLGWLPPLAMLAWAMLGASEGLVRDGLLYAAAALAIVQLGVVFKTLVVDRWRVGRVARRVRRALRVVGRNEASWSKSLMHIDRMDLDASTPARSDSEDARYAMMQRLRRVAHALGCSGILVIVDRVDEPTLINGDTERMRALIWPMFNNKFLQQEGMGFKLLLPIELRYALFKESSAFFQEARLDKQNLIERLSWTGAMLYDLCDARLQACRSEGAEPMALLDLFAEDVSRQDLVDALDQMHQPRDAFKFLYRCLSEHCSNVTKDQNAWRIPRLVLESVRKSESDRVQQLYRGIRPA